MNILTHPVTPIVAVVVVVAILIAVTTKVASNRRKARAREEERRMRERVERQLIDEQRSKPKPLPASRHAGLRRSAVTNRYQPSLRSNNDASYDPSAALITTGLLYNDPSPYCAPSSSSSYDGGSSSSSSDSGSSSSGGDSGGSCGGGGGE